MRGHATFALFVLTAGHCRPFASAPGFYRSTENPPKPGGKAWSFIGNAFRDAIAVERAVRTDAAAIGVTADGIIPQGVFEGNDASIPVRSARTSRIGETLCFSGAGSGVEACGKVVARSVDWVEEHGIGRGGYWVRFTIPPKHGDSGSPVYTIAGNGVGLVTAGRPSSTLEETLVEPLLHPPRMGPDQVPGILDNPSLGHLSLKLGP